MDQYHVPNYGIKQPNNIIEQLISDLDLGYLSPLTYSAWLFFNIFCVEEYCFHLPQGQIDPSQQPHNW